LDKALDLDPKYVDAYNGRGGAWLEKREYDKAIADYTTALELDPEHKFAYRAKAWRGGRKATSIAR
jgi:lipoprotein NlpI